MTRSPILRVGIAVILLIVALVGIVVQVRLLQSPFADGQTRLVLGAYILVAIYAAASLAARIKSSQR